MLRGVPRFAVTLSERGRKEGGVTLGVRIGFAEIPMEEFQVVLRIGGGVMHAWPAGISERGLSVSDPTLCSRGLGAGERTWMTYGES